MAVAAGAGMGWRVGQSWRGWMGGWVGCRVVRFDIGNDHISMSRAWSYLTVGITELMNFKNMMSAWWGLIFLPLALESSMNRFMTSECLQGWMVSILQSRKGQFSSVTVSFWYSEQISWNISLEVSGLPLKSLPLIHSLGVKQYSSQDTQMSYFRNYSYTSSAFSSPVISTNPHSSLFLLYTMDCLVSLWMRCMEVAAQCRYCFPRLGSSLLGLMAFCHFQPKLVSWSPATTNWSGESTPLPSKSLSAGVNLELTKFFKPSNIIIIKQSWRTAINYKLQAGFKQSRGQKIGLDLTMKVEGLLVLLVYLNSKNGTILQHYPQIQFTVDHITNKQKFRSYLTYHPVHLTSHETPIICSKNLFIYSHSDLCPTPSFPFLPPCVFHRMGQVKQ